ncbi:hypothetical protein V1525DRAFT_265556 [Lipomyces kononenkoae]|uniref:Uncharacterized protein n=1 Tax=Lipomyces kononenkoae TaxID=34357 RepID=A0ACC3T8Q0_LIPKO
MKWATENLRVLIAYPRATESASAQRPFLSINCERECKWRGVSYASHLDVLKSQLDALDAKVSLTYDVWTAKANLPYASIIMARFIDNDWNMHSRIVGFKNFSYPHTGQRHQELSMESILNFGLQTKVIGSGWQTEIQSTTSTTFFVCVE